MTTGMDNPWRTVLKGLRVPQHNVPKQVAEWQYYMRKNREQIREIYEERETTAAKTGIALRSSIAQELVAKLSEDERERLKAGAKAEWDAVCDRFKEASHGNPSSDPRDQLE